MVLVRVLFVKDSVFSNFCPTMNSANRLRIDQLTFDSFRTKETRNSQGKLERERIPVKVARKIQVVDGGGRLLHAFIDGLIINCIGFLLQLGFWGIPDSGHFVLNIFTSFFFSFYGFAMRPMYYGVCESIWQSTPGKMLFGRVVINEFAEKPSVGVIAVRSLIRLIPFEAFSCISERGWHDTWPDTWVVHKTEAAALLEARQKQEAEIIEKWKADWEKYNREMAEQAAR